MDNQLQSISKIFTEKLFRIPDYQRGYAWEAKQLKDYWNDILQLEPEKNHYVGVLTLEKVPKQVFNNWDDDKWIINSKNFEPFYVVDGQQRLTTTIILLQSLTEAVNENQLLNYTSVSEIRKRYIFDSKDDGASRSYIFGYEKDNPSYEFLKMKIFNENSTSGYQKEITIYTHNLEFAKNFFISKLADLSIDEKEVIFKKVTQSLLFNIYTISSDIDVFIAFETMNNRGKPLSNLEKLKNRLIYLSTKFDAEDTEKNQLRKIINDGWKGIYHFLGKNKDNPLYDDKFLYNHCTVYFGDEIFPTEDIDLTKLRRNHFYSQFGYDDFLLDEKFTYKNILSEEGKLTISRVKDYVESLQESVEIWFNIYNPTICTDYSVDEKLLLDKLYRIGLGNNLSAILLAFYLRKPNAEIRIKFLQKIERLIFISTLTLWRYNRPRLIHPIIAMKVFKEELTISDFIRQIDEFIYEILNKSDFLDRLTEKFKNEGFYQWNCIRYFLYEYEMSLRSSSKANTNKINWMEYDIEQEDFVTVEHIYPQTANSECWKIKFNSYGLKQRRIMNNSLGNLLPLSKPKNSSLQNRCFLDKVDNSENSIGYKYGSYSENEISGLREWTPQLILDRGLKLLKFMEKRWNLDFKSNEKRIEILNLTFVKRPEPIIATAKPKKSIRSTLPKSKG